MPKIRRLRWTSLYVILAATLTSILLALAWWAGRVTPRQEARRLGHIELRILRQARDRLVDHLTAMQYRLRFLATQPSVIAPENKIPDPMSLDRTLGQLDLEGVCLRRYGVNGALLLDLPIGVPRVPRLADDELKRLLEWSKKPESADEAMFDLEESTSRSEPSAGRDLIRYAVSVWSPAAPGKPAEPRGVLCLWVPSATLLSHYLLATHILPESYTFTLFWTGKGPPALVWHSAEPQWVRSSAADASHFLDALRQQTDLDEVVGETFDVFPVPRRDGSEREEVVAIVPVVFGARRWIIGLSTPYSVAVEFSATQRSLMLVLCGLTLAVLAVGVGILAFQRTQLLALAREQRLRQLREVQHHYAELFAENPAAMLILEGTTLVDCNHSAERLIGLSRAEATGMSLLDLFEEASVRPAWESLLAKGHLSGRDVALTRRVDQTTVLVELWGRLIGERWILMAHNVEQRRDLEQQIARLKRMDSIGSLASTLAHDFNNLLGQVQILVSRLRLDAPEGSPLAEDVSAIEKRIEDASQLVSNLLASRETITSRQPIAIDQILREFAADQSKLVPEGVSFVFEARPDLPMVWVTPHALRRVLDNLCLNACDAMPYGGTLTLRAGDRRIEDHAATEQLPVGHYAVIEVIDTGVGMSRELLDTVFDPFFTTKRRGQGMGLGLWTVYRIVRRLGGWVHVQSRLGKGTQFAIFLPSRPPMGFDAEAASSFTEENGESGDRRAPDRTHAPPFD